ncbi:MAG: bifunctional (p)ppGpp synthetase/guanosine-3',5'-bis(diphosphate) 3'-pyrophosphohydrolase [Steroidobacteraceae bacterium]
MTPTVDDSVSDSPALQTALTTVSAALPESALKAETLIRAQAIAAIVQPLGVADEIVIGAMLYPVMQAGLLDEQRATELLGTAVTRMATDSVRLKQYEGAGGASGQSRSASQAESLRKMLLAIAADARLVFIRLADQLYQLRHAKALPAIEQERLARETREIFAPLANRLGIWQLKWQLEDLSFRYLNPDAYKRIAGWLASKRADRERYLAEVQAELHAALTKAEVHAEIASRPKHIYSIWRKMQRKGLNFEQVYDVRAVRLLVDNLADCYAALGVVHGLWPFIPGEFDDYIATPKDNLYRSLHTAVIGPGKLPLEVQIRTKDMHEHAELGVAAHWKYKEGRYKEGGRSDVAYEQKIAWLRQILDPAEHSDDQAESETDFLERMRAELFEDRVYALSPRGEVVDLPKGATPLDYAYQVHTELGHRCRGAKLNGHIVPLTQALTNGDQVEIITAKQPHPSRDWLAPSRGFLASPRSRAKVRAWFRKQDEGQNIVQGKLLLEREIQRLGVHSITLPELLAELHLSTVEQLYQALGVGDLTLAQINGAIQRRTQPQEPPPVAGKSKAAKPIEGIRVDGVGKLLSSFARCCRPVPPEAIAGYITVGRGVSIHRQDCASFKRLQNKQPERVIPVDWGSSIGQEFVVEIMVRAYDRRGLLRDISAVLADAKLNLQAMNTLTQRDGVADIQLRIVVHNLEELSTALGRIQGLSNVLSVRRKI